MPTLLQHAANAASVSLRFSLAAASAALASVSLRFSPAAASAALTSRHLQGAFDHLRNSFRSSSSSSTTTTTTTIAATATTLALSLSLCSAQSLLRSGPMLGYNECREVMIWVQTTEPARVSIQYTSDFADSQAFMTQEVATTQADCFTAHLIADQVQPGQKYSCILHLNGQPIKLPYPLEFTTQPIWKWRADPPTVRFTAGSCFFVNEAPYDRPGTPYGRSFEILDALQQQKPHFMLWLGDNVYYREADWTSFSGMAQRYTHTRSHPGLQPFLASTHHYAIWDDHDFGPNDSDRGFYLAPDSKRLFNLFWANPGSGLPGNPAAVSHFTWADLEFFLLDNRTHRTPDGWVRPDDTQLGRQQVDWLLDGLRTSQASFKFVCLGGQFLNPAMVYETYANTAPEEREYILKAITDAKIPGVVFLTGDRHHTELSLLTTSNGLKVYDLTVSPLTSGPNPKGEQEANTLRVPGTFVGENNFVTLEVTGKEKERLLTATAFSATGKQLWQQTLQQ